MATCDMQVLLSLQLSSCDFCVTIQKVNCSVTAAEQQLVQLCDKYSTWQALPCKLRFAVD